MMTLFIKTNPLTPSWLQLDQLFPYEYQYSTYQHLSVSRHIRVSTFFRIPRIKYSMFRYNIKYLRYETIFYLITRFRSINLQRIQLGYTDYEHSRSKKWKRRVGRFRKRRPFLRLLLTPHQLFSFWGLFIMVYLACRIYFPIKRRVGTGPHLIQWFMGHRLFWEYPFTFGYSGSNERPRYERTNFFFKIHMSRGKRDSFVMDRDLYRFLSFPIEFYVPPRMWQTDPLKRLHLVRLPAFDFFETLVLIEEERNKKLAQKEKHAW